MPRCHHHCCHRQHTPCGRRCRCRRRRRRRRCHHHHHHHHCHAIPRDKKGRGCRLACAHRAQQQQRTHHHAVVEVSPPPPPAAHITWSSLPRRRHRRRRHHRHCHAMPTQVARQWAGTRRKGVGVGTDTAAAAADTARCRRVRAACVPVCLDGCACMATRKP